MASRDRGLSAADTKALKAFLASPSRPEGTLSFHELQGFLYAVACSPETVMPSDWVPLISNDTEMGYADTKEASAILGRIMQLYNDVNAGVLARSEALPAGCAFRRGILANLDEDAPISQWSRGFMIGHDWLSDVWNAALPEALEEDYGVLVVTLSFFASRQLAEAYLTEMITAAGPATDDKLERIAKAMRNAFPSALASYAHLGRSLAELNA